MTTKRQGSELFYIDENGEKQDRELHEEILREGDHEAALAISRRIATELGIDEKGLRALYGDDAGATDAEQDRPDQLIINANQLINLPKGNLPKGDKPQDDKPA